MLTAGKVPHSLCVRGQGAVSQLSVFQNTLPFHGFQAALLCNCVGNILALEGFFSPMRISLRGAWECRRGRKIQGIQQPPSPIKSFLCPRPHTGTGDLRHCPPRAEFGGRGVLRKPMADSSGSGRSKERNSGQEILYTHGNGVRARAGSTSIKGTSNFLTWKVTRKEEGPRRACSGLL